jgi:hypothetical protein
MIVYRDKEAKRIWQRHVKNTPCGMVPVLINGQVPAYQSAMGTDFAGDRILRWFDYMPKRCWPAWLTR